MKEFLKKIRFLLTKRDKKLLVLMLFASIFISLLETLGVAIIVPFVHIASNFNNIHENKYFHDVYEYFNFSSDVNFIICFGVLLIAFYMFRSATNFSYFYALSSFAKGRSHHIAYRLLENYLGRDYKNFTKLNSSTLSKNIVSEVGNFTGVLQNILFILSEVFIVILIYTMLILVNWKITILLTFFLTVNIALLLKTVSKKIKMQGHERHVAELNFFDIITSTFRNFKIIKIKNQDKKVLDAFSKSSQKYARANILNDSVSHLPRLILEALGFSIVVFIVVYLVFKNKMDISEALPIISVFILGLYRLMPSANRILENYNSILFQLHSVEILHNDMLYEIDDLGDERIEFKKDIKVKNLHFSYDEKPLLKGIDFTINKNEKIGIVGESGSGKSTLIDIINGLYKPKKGGIFIDDVKLCNENVRSWREKIGYVPQDIYLFNGSVAQNVAFGEEYDEARVKKVLKKASILDFFTQKHDGILTEVGENGILLSGGQRQRIAIARALYEEPDLLIFDEATSSLDIKTEDEIIKEIYATSKNKTLIIITHRPSTVEDCDRIYEIKDGALKRK